MGQPIRVCHAGSRNHVVSGGNGGEAVYARNGEKSGQE